MIDRHQLLDRAQALGFEACGIADLGPNAHGGALDSWLQNGYAGSMRYMHRQMTKRKNPSEIVPGAIRAVVILDNYYSPDQGESAPIDLQPLPELGRRIARYARGQDYHSVTAHRLEKLAAYLIESGATIARVFVDAGPVPERELAQRAGLGWIGKNTMLIHPGKGSFFFIGSILTDLPLPLDPPFPSDHCGSCTRCLEACPTGAFVAPRVLDANRCISFLTIEHRGPFPPAADGNTAGWAFGCDVCNEVCPWNERFAAPTSVAAFLPRPAPDPRDAGLFDRMSETEFASRFGDTPLERAGLEGMRRNWRVAQ